jgi:hypothetical protein
MNRREFLQIAGSTLGTIFLPQITVPSTYLSERLGCQIEGDVATIKKWLVPGRIYQIPIKWRDIEPTPGTYVWPEIYDNNVSLLASYPFIITIKVCPEWARLWPDVGSPVSSLCYNSLSNFICAIQERYNPEAIELFNEPDVKRKDGKDVGEYFGSWVDDNETYYQGGQRYGQCVSSLQNLGVKMLYGALSMHDQSLEFLRGAKDSGLNTGAISFHCNIWRADQFGRAFELARKIKNIVDLPVVMTETTVIGEEDSLMLMDTQKDYLKFLRRNYSEIDSINWYAFNSEWKNNDLIRNNYPTPVYEEFINGNN